MYWDFVVPDDSLLGQETLIRCARNVLKSTTRLIGAILVAFGMGEKKLSFDPVNTSPAQITGHLEARAIFAALTLRQLPHLPDHIYPGFSQLINCAKGLLLDNTLKPGVAHGCEAVEANIEQIALDSFQSLLLSIQQISIYMWERPSDLAGAHVTFILLK